MGTVIWLAIRSGPKKLIMIRPNTRGLHVPDPTIRVWFLRLYLFTLPILPDLNDELTHVEVQAFKVEHPCIPILIRMYIYV